MIQMWESVMIEMWESVMIQMWESVMIDRESRSWFRWESWSWLRCVIVGYDSAEPPAMILLYVAVIIQLVTSEKIIIQIGLYAFLYVKLSI
jgi:hypothetical protein